MPATSSMLLLLPVVGAIALLPSSLRRQPAAGVALLALALTASNRVETPSASFVLINGILLWSGLCLVASALVAGRQRVAPAKLGFLALTLVLILGTSAAFWQGRVVASMLAGVAVSAGLALLPQRVTPSPTVVMQPARRGGLRRWVMLALICALLVPALWYSAIVAGPGGLWSTRLSDVPFSSAGETLLAALLLPATLVLAGVWPLTGLAPGAWLAPLAGLLLFAAVSAVPEGVEHWRSAYALWLIAAAFFAGWRSEWPAMLVCGGLFAIACGDATARDAGLSLVVMACALELVRSTGLGGKAGVAILLCAIVAAIVALPGTMTTEVVYSTALVLVVITGLLRSPGRVVERELST